MNPKIIPGINSQILLNVQLFQRIIEPTMTERKKYLQIPILLPLIDSQTIAKMIPPEPFHPTNMQSNKAIQKLTHSIFNFLSFAGFGKQGVISHLLMMAKQFIKNDTRKVTKMYWLIGIENIWDVFKWRTISNGASMMRVKVENQIFGQLLNSLYQKSFQSIPATMEASLLSFGVSSGSSAGSTNFSFKLLLVIFNIILSLVCRVYMCFRNMIPKSV